MKYKISILLLLAALVMASCIIANTERGNQVQSNISSETESTATQTISPTPASTPFQTPGQEPTALVLDMGDITKIGNTNNNLYHYGYVAYDGERQYFGAVSYPWMENLYIEGLWSINDDGTDIRRISYDIPIYINVVDDYIYYIKQTKYYTDLHGPIIKIKKDGSEREVLVQDDCSGFIVIGNWIYFIDNETRNLFKVSLDGKHLTKIVDERCISFQYEDGWLYYNAKNTENNLCTLYKLDIRNGSEPIKIASDFPWRFTLYKGRIFYVYWEDYISWLYRMNDDGTEVTMLRMWIDNFAIDDDRIYYFMDYEYKVLYSMDLEGNDVDEIFNDPETDILGIHGIAGQYIYLSSDVGEWMENARVKKDGTDCSPLTKLLRDTDFLKN